MIELKKEILLACISDAMPFGKYKGCKICDLPLFYLEWFLRKEGFPKGKLGEMMSTMYHIKLNGLEDILKPLKSDNGYSI